MIKRKPIHKSRIDSDRALHTLTNIKTNDRVHQYNYLKKYSDYLKLLIIHMH